MTAGPQHPAPSDLAAIGPVLAVTAAAVATLLLPMLKSRRSMLVSAAVAVVGLLAAFALTFAAPHGQAFRSMLVIDSAAILWQRLAVLFVAGVVLIGAAHRQSVRAADSPEYFVLLLSATAGMMLMAATTHLLVMLLAMEIASMPSYVLAGFRKGRRRSAEASLKFALFGAVCTAVMIYGISLLYGTHHTLDVSAIAHQSTMPPLAAVGWLFVLVGVLFKIGGVPLHFWLPDAFDGAETAVAAFLSVASKGAGVMLLARLVSLLDLQSASTARAIAGILAVIAVLTMSIGNLAAWRQRDVKRLLAYSSIAHAGYMLSALALPGGPALAAVAIYLLIYAVMNLGAFSVLADVESAAGSTDAEAFAGLATRAPLAATAMAVCLFSMIGLPPAAGFLAKWKIIAALAGGGGAWWIVAVAVAINSILSMAVYARVLRAMYLRPAKDDKRLAFPAGWLAAGCAVALVLLLIAFARVEKLAESAAVDLLSAAGPR